jgi:hypothetical protein
MESIKEIRILLERFYQGETSLEEELRLQRYFASHTVPEELIPDKELFKAFGEGEDSVEVPEELDEKILQSLDRLEKKETRTRRISMYSLSGLAAGLLVMIAVYLFFLRDDNRPMLASNQIADTYADPMQAYEEAKKTLVYVSNKLNTGTSELEQVKQVSKMTTEPLQSLSKINKGSKELSLLGQLRRVGEVESR